MNRLRCCVVVVCSMSIAAVAAPIDPERDRIAAERGAAMTAFAEQERRCQAQFIVVACVDAARKAQRATLARLLRQQAALDDSRRREVAAARRQAIQDKAARHQARASAPAAAALPATAHRAPRPHPLRAAGSADGSRGRSPADRTVSAEQRSAEQRSEAKFEARASAAQLHREAVQRRNAQRAAQGKVAAPLPLPPAASAP